MYRLLGLFLFNGIDPGASFYFVHSYVLNPESAADVAATSDYGTSFPVAVQRNHIFGVQFHPEKSQNNGLRLLKNFYDCVEWQ